MSGRLYVVAMPIGQPEDLGLRARALLSEVGVLAAEDTRVARAQLRALGLPTPPRLISYHDHVEEQRIPGLLAALEGGEEVALISDAGTPLLSDPGFRLVRAALDAGIEVVPVPGPSALLAALVASGLPPDRFTFLGFLPRTQSKRREQLAPWAHRPETLILYEAPHRILQTLIDAREVLGDRPASLGISLTKVWERFYRGPLGEVHDAAAAEGELKGEMTLVIGGYTGEAVDEDRARVQALIGALVEAGVAPGTVRDAVASTFGWSRREVYQYALAAREPEG